MILMWLNWSVVIINTTLQILNIYIDIDVYYNLLKFFKKRINFMELLFRV